MGEEDEVEDVHLARGGIDADVDCWNGDCKKPEGEEREGVELYAHWMMFFRLSQNLEKSARRAF